MGCRLHVENKNSREYIEIGFKNCQSEMIDILKYTVSFLNKKGLTITTDTEFYDFSVNYLDDNLCGLIRTEAKIFEEISKAITDCTFDIWNEYQISLQQFVYADSDKLRLAKQMSDDVKNLCIQIIENQFQAYGISQVVLIWF